MTNLVLPFSLCFKSLTSPVPALLPLIGLLVELEELCAHLESLLLELLVGLDLNFLGETDDGFEMDIF